MAVFGRRPSDDQLVTLLQERRRAPDPQTMAYLERWQAARASGPPPRRRPGPGAEEIAAMHPTASRDEVAPLLAFQEELRSLIRAPTVYETSAHHVTVQTRAVLLDQAVAGFGRWRADRDAPVFAVVDHGRPEVRSTRVPENGDHIVLVDTELMTFLWLFSKAAALALPTERDGSGLIAVSAGSGARADGGGTARFRDAVLHYVLAGRASDAESYHLRDDRDALALASMIVTAAETFAMAHEYVRVLEGTTETTSSTTLSVADDLALELTIDVAELDGHSTPFMSAYWGAELTLQLDMILLEALSLLRSGDTTQGLRNGERDRYTLLGARRRVLRFLVRRRVERASADQQEAEQTLGAVTLLSDVVTTLWARVVPTLRRGYGDGVRPAPVWEDAR